MVSSRGSRHRVGWRKLHSPSARWAGFRSVSVVLRGLQTRAVILDGPTGGARNYEGPAQCPCAKHIGGRPHSGPTLSSAPPDPAATCSARRQLTKCQMSSITRSHWRERPRPPPEPRRHSCCASPFVVSPWPHEASDQPAARRGRPRKRHAWVTSPKRERRGVSRPAGPVRTSQITVERKC